MNYWMIFGGLIVTHIEASITRNGIETKYNWIFWIVGILMMLSGLKLI